MTRERKIELANKIISYSSNITSNCGGIKTADITDIISCLLGNTTSYDDAMKRKSKKENR